VKSDLSSNTGKLCQQSHEPLEATQPDQLSQEVNQFVHDLYGDMSKADLATFLGLLYDEALPSLLSLEQALTSGDFPVAAQKAHKLRNITGAVGAADLHRYLGGLEEDLQSGTARLHASELQGLHEVWEQLVRALGSIRERLSRV
jgi:HPt (histidine-containing phosphotransfer) domain-containing protein